MMQRDDGQWHPGSQGTWLWTRNPIGTQRMDKAEGQNEGVSRQARFKKVAFHVIFRGKTSLGAIGYWKPLGPFEGCWKGKSWAGVYYDKNRLILEKEVRRFLGHKNCSLCLLLWRHLRCSIFGGQPCCRRCCCPENAMPWEASWTGHKYGCSGKLPTLCWPHEEPSLSLIKPPLASSPPVCTCRRDCTWKPPGWAHSQDQERQ